MGEASPYASAAADPDIRPIYVELAAATPMHTAYNFALYDGLHALEIHGLMRKE